MGPPHHPQGWPQPQRQGSLLREGGGEGRATRQRGGLGLLQKGGPAPQTDTMDGGWLRGQGKVLPASSPPQDTALLAALAPPSPSLPQKALPGTLAHGLLLLVAVHGTGLGDAGGLRRGPPQVRELPGLGEEVIQGVAEVGNVVLV